jgi:guanylate kinase
MSEVVLQHKEEFKAVLDGYQPSQAARETLSKIPLVIMLGVAGGGRNTIINHLVNSGNYHFIISDTTRPPKFRDGKMEQDGVNYNFRKEEDILQDLKDGKFLEAELIHNQQVSGISVHELERAAATGKVPINEIDLGGTVAVRNAKPDTKFFFIVPPSYKEWMYRLQGREVMSPQELRNRLETAVRVLNEGLASEDFIFVVNDSSHRSAERIDEEVRGGIGNQSEHTAGRQAAEEILRDLTTHLEAA